MVPSTLTVTTNADSGAGSLRAAIAAAVSGDTINFDANGLSGGQTITLTSGSLVPTVNLTITDAGALAVSIVSTTSRVFDFPLSSPGTLTAVTLQGLTLNGTANDGTTGGAIHVATPNTFFTLTVDSCNITGALAVAGAATRGGAISVTGLNDSLTVTNCAIQGTVTTVNTVSNNDAGALYVATTKTVSVTNSTLSGMVSGSTAGDNRGGAVYQNSGTLNLTNCTISNSYVVGAKGSGGGMNVQGGTANLTGCTISGSSASNNGGGLYVGKGTVNLSNCTIAGNTAGNNGGGVSAWFYSSNGTGGTSVTNLTNCTISGNTAAAGAGLYLGYIKPTTGMNPTGKNTVTVNNTIISGSVVRKTGGVITDSNEVLNASNSLFDTTPTIGAGNTINGTNTSNLFGANPMLDTLQNNGGQTQTLALLAGSPAINAGDSTLATTAGLTTDQRGAGFPRIRGNSVDIGAYEYDGDFSLTITPNGTTTSASPITFTFQFATAVTGFTAGSVAIANGTAGAFTAVAPDTYTLDVAPTADGTVTVSVTAGAAQDTSGFQNLAASASVTSNRPAQFSGVVFLDANANGSQDANDSPLSGRTVFIDLNSNGSLDTGESSATTDASGSYQLTGVTAGTYTVAVVLFPGDVGTGPPGGSGFLSLAPGDNRTDIDFGLRLNSTTYSVPVANDLFGATNSDTTTALVHGYYEATLGRAPEAGGQTYWVGQSATVSRTALATSFLASDERLGNQVDGYYQTFLNHSADAAGRAYWIAQLQAGVDPATVVQGFLTSSEYQQAHASDDSFVRALYQDLLGRDGDTAGINYWDQQLGTGTDRSQVIQGFLRTTEAYQRAVDSFYTQFLQRVPGASEDGYWVNQLTNGSLSLQQVAAGILASDEFFNRASSTVN